MSRTYRQANYEWIYFYSDDETGKNGVEWRSSEENAQYRLVPKEEYYEFLKASESASEGSVVISEEEYNGFQKAVEIVRRRAKQQIDKSKADEHGYTLLRADKRQYSYKYDSPAWLITMSTPYSIKMTLEEVTAMLDRDLRDFYGFLDLPQIESVGFTHEADLKKWDIKDFFSTMKYHDREADRDSIQNTEVLQKLDFLDSCDWKLAFEISRIARNAATGCYEVSYWATEPM